MKLRRVFIQFVAGMLVAGSAFAQSYPAKSVRVIVPYGTGSATDALATQVRRAAA